MQTSLLLVVAAASIGAALALGVFALGGGLGAPSRGERALDALARYRPGSGPVEPAAASARERLVTPTLTALRHLAVRISPSGTARSLQRRLDVAGNPKSWTVERLLATKGLGLVGLGAIGALLGSGGIATFLIFTLAGAAVGFFLPDILLYNVGSKRQTEIQRSISDVLDMLTVCVEAGLGFDAALRQVARGGKGPLAAELVRVLQEMQIGKSRGEALRALSGRTTVPELKAVISALVQADALGIPVAGVLREQSKEMRLKRRQRAEEKAQQVPVKILFPLIFFIFPALFIIILGPAAISIAENFGGR